MTATTVEKSPPLSTIFWPTRAFFEISIRVKLYLFRILVSGGDKDCMVCGPCLFLKGFHLGSSFLPSSCHLRAFLSIPCLKGFFLPQEIFAPRDNSAERNSLWSILGNLKLLQEFVIFSKYFKSFLTFCWGPAWLSIWRPCALDDQTGGRFCKALDASLHEWLGLAHAGACISLVPVKLLRHCLTI